MGKYEWVETHGRRLTRLKGYDYAQANYYFVTICAQGHRCIFGTTAWLSPIGEVARREMEQLPAHSRGVSVDKFVVMPNHIHAIIIFTDSHDPGRSLSSIVGCYKAAVSREVHKFAPDLKVWQTSFYDEVIRNEPHYLSVWNYIDGNPSQWEEDQYNVR